MVKSFHTAELESLMNVIDRGHHSRNGRSKSDMLKRVLDHIDRGVSFSVELKIKDLYGKQASSSSFSSSSHRGSSSSHSRSHSSSLGTASKSSVKSSLSVSNSRLSADSSSVRRSGQSEPSSRRPATSGPVRREVTLKALPFYDVLHEIMKPSSLGKQYHVLSNDFGINVPSVPTQAVPDKAKKSKMEAYSFTRLMTQKLRKCVPRSTAKQQEVRFNFTLTQQQCDDISNSRADSSPDCHKFGVQIQLRFCVADNSSQQPDCFPPGASVKVNNETAPLPSLIPTNKPGAEPKRPGRPVDVTPLCNLTPSVANSIVVSWTVQESRQTHSASIYLVKKLNSQCLLDRLKQNCTRRGDYTKTMIKEKLSLDKDSEIATTGMFVSLICPIGKTRMQVPIRTATCDHLQCFDAITFLMMNERKPTWMCPVCDRPADYFKLIIDGLLCEIIAESPTATEIEMSRDGQWRITQTQDLDDDDDDDDFDYPTNESHQTPDATPEPSEDTVPQETTEGVATGYSIDLTESDDERLIGEESTNNSVIADSSTRVSTSHRSESHDSDAMSMSPPSSPETAWELLDALPLPVNTSVPQTIPLPSPSMTIPLPSEPSLPIPLPESASIPLPVVPPSLPHNVGHPSFYPTTKIAISLRSNPSQSTAPSVVNAAHQVSQTSLEAANGSAPNVQSERQGSENGSMVDFLSIMSGVSGYGAFTMAPNQSMPRPPPPNGR